MTMMSSRCLMALKPISSHANAITHGHGRTTARGRYEPIDSQLIALNKAIIGQAALKLSGVIESERVEAYHLWLDATRCRPSSPCCPQLKREGWRHRCFPNNEVKGTRIIPDMGRLGLYQTAQILGLGGVTQFV
jgi:hypothetical protein